MCYLYYSDTAKLLTFYEPMVARYRNAYLFCLYYIWLLGIVQISSSFRVYCFLRQVKAC